MIVDQTHLYVYKGLDGRFPKKEKILMVDLQKKVVVVRDEAFYFSGSIPPPIFSCPTSANVMTFFWSLLNFGQKIGHLRGCVKSSPPISKNSKKSSILLNHPPQCST